MKTINFSFLKSPVFDLCLPVPRGANTTYYIADQTKTEDVSGDGEITGYDGALIAQRAVGLIISFFIGGVSGSRRNPERVNRRQTSQRAQKMVELIDKFLAEG